MKRNVTPNKMPAKKPRPALESDEQKRIKEHLDKHYPKLIYKFDWLSGAKLSIGLAKKAKSLGNTRSYPDLFISFPSQGFHGLFIELKRPGTRILKKNGEYANDHYKEQGDTLSTLNSLGYLARFEIGSDNACKTIDSYLADEYKTRYSRGCSC